MKIKVDTAVEVAVSAFPLTDDADFKTRKTALTYDQAGMDLVWNFQTPDGAITQTAVTPTTAGDYDWTHLGDGIYKIEIPASGGVSINNDTEGYGWFSGFCTGVLPWVSPIYEFVPANISDSLVKGTDLLDINAAQWNGTAVAVHYGTSLPLVDATGAMGIAYGAVEDAGSLTASNIELGTMIPSYRDGDTSVAAYVGGMLHFLDGACAGEEQRIITFDAQGSGHWDITVASAFSTIPSVSDTCLLLPAVSVSQMVDDTITDDTISAGAVSEIQSGLATSAALTTHDTDIKALEPLGTAMRGTDNAALASVCTETRLAELDAANLPTDAANIAADTAAILLDTGTDGVVVAAGSKTGYSLDADQSAVTIGTVTTLTGHTAQTGDSFARLGAPAGASVSADVAAVKTDTGNLVTRITAALFSGITSLAEWLGLLAGKQAADATALAEIKATGAGSGTYSETTDSLEAIQVDVAAVTAAIDALNDFDPAADTVANVTTVGTVTNGVVTILPLASSPQATGRFTPVYITAYQYTKINAVLAIFDADDQPVNLSGKTIALCAWDKDDTATTVITMRSDGAEPELSIGGDDNNQVTIAGGVTHTASACQLDWRLYDLTDSTSLATGVLNIEEGVELPT